MSMLVQSKITVSAFAILKRLCQGFSEIINSSKFLQSYIVKIVSTLSSDACNRPESQLKIGSSVPTALSHNKI